MSDRLRRFSEREVARMFGVPTASSQRLAVIGEEPNESGGA